MLSMVKKNSPDFEIPGHAAIISAREATAITFLE